MACDRSGRTMPIVAMNDSVNVSLEKRVRRFVLPTPLSPMRTSLKANSLHPGGIKARSRGSAGGSRDTVYISAMTAHVARAKTILVSIREATGTQPPIQGIVDYSMTSWMNEWSGGAGGRELMLAGVAHVVKG
jgi:hypothetical protein